MIKRKRFKDNNISRYEGKMRRKTLFGVQVILLYISILLIFLSVFSLSKNIALFIFGALIIILALLLKQIMRIFEW